MSIEQTWTLDRCDWLDVFAAAERVADRHDLRFWGHSEANTMTVRVQFPTEGAAELAASLSDVYDADDAADDLDELEGKVDLEAAKRAGVATRIGEGWTLDVDRHPEFVLPAPERYTCAFEIDWAREEAVLVYSNTADNRSAWPLIVSFVDAVVEELGGSWVQQ